MVINIVGAEHRAGKLLQQVGLFIRDAVRADDADGFASPRVPPFAELLADVVQRDLPADVQKLAVRLANHGLGNTSLVVREIEGVAPLVAQKVTVNAGLVAVIAT